MNTKNLNEIPDCRVIIVGAMGVGKSTVGKLLAEILAWEYIDNDFEISKLASLSIKQLSQLDIPTLHTLESDYLKDILTRPTPLIAGAAASIADNLDLIDALENEFTVYLYSPLENLMKNAGTTGVTSELRTINKGKHSPEFSATFAKSVVGFLLNHPKKSV